MGMKRRRPLPRCEWRYAGGYYYYEDGKYGYGYIHRTASGNGWFACLPGHASNVITLLRDAKKWVETEFAKRG